MLYTINVMMEVLGTSLSSTRENKQFFDTYWKALDKQKAKTFLFIYSAIFDKFTANMDMLEETFPQSEVKDELMDRIKTGLDIIKKEVNKAPEAPPRQDIYEQVLGEGSTDSNETNDEETPEDDPNSDRHPPSSHQTGQRSARVSMESRYRHLLPSLGLDIHQISRS